MSKLEATPHLSPIPSEPSETLESPVDTIRLKDEISEELPISSGEYLRSATSAEIIERLKDEIKKVIKKTLPKKEDECFLSIYDTGTSIDSWDADSIYLALKQHNADRKKNVILFLISHGGSVEAAYKITKLCKQYSAATYEVIIPRHAKSAATLIAIGADLIHMGPLGELGPIDPQLGGLPALGVKRALEIIATIGAKYPKSSELFAKYLGSKLSIEQIGYCDRVSESAVQYAERLLVKKSGIDDPNRRAWELVNEYKDHGFVIDVEEAKNHLGSDWIKSDSPEILFGDAIYELLNSVDFMLRFVKKQRLVVVGSLLDGAQIWVVKE